VGRPDLTDIIRAMLTEGYSSLEIHRVLTGAGYPAGETWLLIEKIESLHQEMGIKPQNERFREIIREELQRLEFGLLDKLERMLRSALRKRKGPQR
jgi:hypothetical protein